MNLQACTLGSGSKGNAALFKAGGVTVMIDAGFSCKELEQRLAAANTPPGSVDALFISHEHGDHVRGAEVFSRRHKVPVYMSPKSADVARLPEKDPHALHPLQAHIPVEVGPWRVTPFPVPHDARETFAFRVQLDGLCAVVISDLGSLTDDVVQHAADADLYLMEFNHDPDMLMEGAYPFHVKYRIRSDYGHLSNGQALELATRAITGRTRCVVLTHLSEENNLPGLALQSAREALKPFATNPPRLMVASQDTPMPWLTLEA